MRYLLQTRTIDDNIGLGAETSTTFFVVEPCLTLAAQARQKVTLNQWSEGPVKCTL